MYVVSLSEQLSLKLVLASLRFTKVVGHHLSSSIIGFYFHNLIFMINNLNIS